ncbi:MAG: DUF418 domain-containing protein [Propioniciclava sp.]|uniref:DUF418 domain-containing protein n=1 Tax=Propioniciclava sp. TaxID=2038686 RepID=UPI0039E2A2DC
MTNTPRPAVPYPSSQAPPAWAPPPPPPWYLPPAASGRSLAPDLARGLMLLLIACANSTWYLWGRPSGLGSAHPTDGSALDKALQAVMAVAVDGRIYPMFALLFGYGMVQFARSRAGRGLPPAAIKHQLFRRHWLLIGFGFVHALLLFGGDILGSYGLAGLVLAGLLFDRSDRVLRRWLIVFAILIAAWAALTSAMAALLMWALDQDPALATEIDASMTSFGGLADMASGHAHYLTALLWRVLLWLGGTPSSVLTLIVPFMVVLGWLAARRGVLEHPDRHRRLLIGVAVTGITVGWLGGLPTALQHLGVLGLPASLSWAPMPLSTATGVFAGAGYAALFALIASRLRRPGPVSGAIAALGRRSLSGYLWQSIVMAPLLAAWGLGIGGRLGTAGMLAIAAGVWLASVVIAARLEARGRPGPFDALLRRLVSRPGHARG